MPARIGHCYEKKYLTDFLDSWICLDFDRNHWRLVLIIIILTWANNDFFNSRDLMDRLKLVILLSDLDWVIALKSPPVDNITAVIRLLIPLPTNYRIIARSEVPGVSAWENEKRDHTIPCCCLCPGAWGEILQSIVGL